MKFIDELDFGDEIRGVVCPECGGSLVWLHGRAYCYTDEYVTPVPEELLPRIRLSKQDKEWLKQYDMEEPE